MSTPPAPDPGTPAPAEVAATLREAPFVRVHAGADGDCLAAAGILARALGRVDIPFQVRTEPDPGPDPRAGDAVAVTVGAGEPDRATGGAVGVPGTTRPASVLAFEAARELGDEPDPVLALSGVVAAGSTPGTDGSEPVLEAAKRRGLVERRPGVAVPTAEPAPGLAGSTLLYAPFSGDESAAAELLECVGGVADHDARRRLASVVALDVATAEGASSRAAETVERALRPYATPAGSFETVGGYADVLDATARHEPGLGVALALGSDRADDALEAWRRRAGVVHGALATATTSRYDGCYVARTDVESAAALPTVARLLRDFCSPEPVVLAIGVDGAAATASVDPRGLASTARTAAGAVDGRAWGRTDRAEARFPSGSAGEFVEAFREVLDR